MKQTLTFIGNGNMALSIAQGVKDRFNIEVVARDLAKADIFEDKLGVSVTKYLLDDFDITDKNIILCVKPNNLQEVGKKLQGKADILYSVLAGTKLESLKSNISAKAYIRTMPNLAASVQESLTTMVGDIEYKNQAIELFDNIGSTVWLNSEKELDIATAVAGSGPAYLALIFEAFCDGAVKQGMKRDDAIKVTNGLFKGFGKLISQTHPAILKDGVMSPGGTTAAGYCAMEKNGVRYGCIEAIEKAFLVTQK